MPKEPLLPKEEVQDLVLQSTAVNLAKNYKSLSEKTFKVQMLVEDPDGFSFQIRFFEANKKYKAGDEVSISFGYFSGCSKEDEDLYEDIEKELGKPLLVLGHDIFD